MYSFFALFLAFVFLIFTVAGETGRGKERPRVFFLGNLVFAGIGTLLLAGTVLTARAVIFVSGFDAEFSGWAWDMLAVYLRLSLIATAAFLLLSAFSFLTAMFDRKQQNGFAQKIRLAAAVVFSVVLLFAAPMYSFLTVNETVALEHYVLCAGFGEVLLC